VPVLMHFDVSRRAPLVALLRNNDSDHIFSVFVFCITVCVDLSHVISSVAHRKVNKNFHSGVIVSSLTSVMSYFEGIFHRFS
jgi:hypothetical protein